MFALADSKSFADDIWVLVSILWVLSLHQSNFAETQILYREIGNT